MTGPLKTPTKRRKRRAPVRRPRAKAVPVALPPLLSGMSASSGSAVLSSIGLPAVRVLIVRRGGFGSTPEEREVDWPTNWRIPTQGDAVHLATDFGGFVESIDWDLGQRVVRVSLR